MADLKSLAGKALDGIKYGIEKKKIDNRINKMIASNARAKTGVKQLAIDMETIGYEYRFPKALVKYMESEYGNYELKKVLEIYIRHEKFKLRNASELERAKRLDVKKVIIRSSEDARVCPVCRKHANKKYTIDKVPQLPLCWECRCYYEPQIL